MKKTQFILVCCFLLAGMAARAAEDLDLYYEPSYTMEIAHNDTTPSITDKTDWGDVDVAGGVVHHNFLIRNNGN